MMTASDIIGKKAITNYRTIKVFNINSISFLSILISLEIDLSFLDLSFIIFFILEINPNYATHLIKLLRSRILEQHR